MSQEHADTVASIGGCVTAWDWALELPKNTTLEQAWNACPDGAWMIWLLSQCDAEQQHKIGLVRARVARLVLASIPDGPGKAIATRVVESLERWLEWPCSNAHEVLFADGMALADLIEVEPSRRIEASYQAIVLADGGDIEEMIGWWREALDLTEEAMLAKTADCVRAVHPWSAVCGSVETLIAEAKEKGPGA
jgi:hypothetical protein